jgi:hypothetical protein
MSSLPLKIFVESPTDGLLAKWIFDDLVKEGSVRITTSSDSSSAISRAESSLLRMPKSPIVLILNCVARPDEVRAPVSRMLDRAAPHGLGHAWHVALAVPDMTRWLKLDPSVVKALDKMGPQSPEARAFLKGWVVNTPNHFDRDGVSALDSEFKSLNEFVTQHTAATT